jgi:hypothetical protein
MKINDYMKVTFQLKGSGCRELHGGTGRNFEIYFWWREKMIMFIFKHSNIVNTSFPRIGLQIFCVFSTRHS